MSVFSRQQNDVSAAVPEIVEIVRALPARALLLDGEAIALRADETPEPFQSTMRRFGRRLDVERLRAELPLSAFFFDLLHLDGEDLLDRSADERFAALAERVAPELRCRVSSRPTPPRRVRSRRSARARSRRHQGEGAGRTVRGGPTRAGGLKIKRAKTLDLVVLAVGGAASAAGLALEPAPRRARSAHGGFVMLGKTFKGITDGC